MTPAEEHMRKHGVLPLYSIQSDGDARMMGAKDDEEALRLAGALFPDNLDGSWEKTSGKLCFVLTWKPA